MRIRIHWLLLSFLLLSFCTLQFSQATVLYSETITNKGVTASSTPPSTGIIFEYGAEEGAVGDAPRPPWDYAGGIPGNVNNDDVYVKISNLRAHGGTKSIRLHQPPPPKEDAERRVILREFDYTYDTSETDFYLSWWYYFDGSLWYAKDDWTQIGGLMLRYTDRDHPRAHGATGSYLYRTGLYFGFGHSSNTVRVSYHHLWSEDGDPYQIKTSHYGPIGEINSSTEDTWWHMQVRYKMGNSSATGRLTAWINGTVIYDVQTQTDPRGDAKWVDERCEWTYGNAPYTNVAFYNSEDQPGGDVYVDDVVLSRTYVPSSYTVVSQPSILGHQSLGWGDGFEDDDFSAWDETYVSSPQEAWANIDPTYSHTGTHSANFTTDGSYNSHAGVTHIIQPTDSIFQRSFVRFEDLPDKDNTNIWVLRVAQSDGQWIASAGVGRSNGLHYWSMGDASGRYNATQDGIIPDQWYELEFYFNATANGSARLWANGTLVCEMAGDFGDLGKIGRVYPYIYINGGEQTYPKTVYHDGYRVANARIGSGMSVIFQTNVYFPDEDELEPLAPLAGVRINGTRLTDSSGLYEWANLDCNKTYTFVIECACVHAYERDHYPAWILNVEGSYSWNGTHYILSHTVTEASSGHIEVYFLSVDEMCIRAVTHKLTSVTANSSCLSVNVAADRGETSEMQIYLADRGHPRPYKIRGATDWNYDPLSETLTVWILHPSEEEVEIEWRQALMGDVPK